MLSKRVIAAIIVNLVNYSNSECPRTFNNSLATVSYNGNELNLEFDGCIQNRLIERFILRSHTKEILKHAFVNLTLLCAIVLDDADVYVLQPGFAENTTQLVTFKADRNQIEMIEKNVFNTLPLQRIRLNCNRIFYIADGAFHGMNLKYLRLNDNKLTNINSTWFHATMLKRLLLSHNDIRSLHSDTFSGIIDMEMLLLEFNKIHYIDYDTFSSQCQLLRLYLAGNSLLSLSFQIVNRLGFVDVSFNLISSIQLDNETTLSNVAVYPNPWSCKCLTRFQDESRELNIEIRESDSLKMSRRGEALSCSDVETECDTDVIRASSLQKQYFKSNNYNNVGMLEYREREFPNHFFKIRYRNYLQQCKEKHVKL